ncbi:MAG: hypothetical protein OXG56_11885 [Gammaproteobacteria bacterium]|nr:hypothetical protein [Gammaproteobacteria bacterium]
MNHELAQKYIACMEEIKKRTSVVTALARGEVNLMYLMTTAESAALQTRKILELIALSSLVANREQYSKSRANFHKDWHATRILDKLKQVNPKFFPVPTRQVKISQGWYDTPPIDSGYLTQEDFIELYDECSTLLHSKNPFSKKSDYDARTFLFKDIPMWIDKIIVLLNHHHVFPVDDSRMYIVLMQAQSDGKVHFAEFEKITN